MCKTLNWEYVDGWNTENSKIWRAGNFEYQAEFDKLDHKFFVCIVKFTGDLFCQHEKIVHTKVDTRGEAKEILGEYGIEF